MHMMDGVRILKGEASVYRHALCPSLYGTHRACLAYLTGRGVCAHSTRAALSAKNYEKICWNETFGYYIADVNSR